MTETSPPVLPQGIPRLGDYRSLLAGDGFRQMEVFSNGFLERNGEKLAGYSKRWVPDPLHQWSRQWEYPFVRQAVAEAVSGRAGPQILDAGSGITFFPWYLASEIPGARITCCDRDASLGPLFDRVNEDKGEVTFLCRDLAGTGLPDASLDIVYSISVLEHTEKPGEIAAELARVLRPGGILAVTFDISLDGLGEIAPQKLGGLVAALEGSLRGTDRESLQQLRTGSLPAVSDRVTTSGPWDSKLLPWRHPLLSTLAAALRHRKLPRRAVREFTFSCHVFRKPEAGEART